MKLLYVALASLLLGCQDRSAGGQVVDGITEQPIAGLRLVARATEPTDMTCQVLEATTDEQGKFLLKAPCRDTPYKLESGDKTIFLAGGPSFVGGVPSEGPWTINAWRGPPGQGVYVLKDADIFAMRQASRVAELPLWKSPDKVLYPETVPAKLPTLAAADFLIISGIKDIQKLELSPLIRHEGKLRFGSRNHYFDMDPWSYIGRKFTSKEDHEAVAANLDEKLVLKLNEENRALKYIPGKALANGVYAMMAPGDRKVYLFEVKQ